MGEKGEGSGGKGGGNWEWGTPLPTPSVQVCSVERVNEGLTTASEPS